MKVTRYDHETRCQSCGVSIPAGAELVEDTIGRPADKPRIACLRCASR